MEPEDRKELDEALQAGSIEEAREASLNRRIFAATHGDHSGI